MCIAPTSDKMCAEWALRESLQPCCSGSTKQSHETLQGVEPSAGTKMPELCEFCVTLVTTFSRAVMQY